MDDLRLRLRGDQGLVDCFRTVWFRNTEYLIYFVAHSIANEPAAKLALFHEEV